ncbi:MAG: VgrG-related protein [Anaerolineae bacterium]|jgi:phage protein D
MTERQLLSQFFIKIDGQDAPEGLMDALIEVAVEDSVHLPDMFSIRLHDPRLQWVDSETLAEGKVIEVSAVASDGGRPERLIAGEITAVEPNFGADGIPSLSIQGYDRSHRLHRGGQTRSFVQMTDSDIAQRIAQEEGLRAEVDSTRQVHDYVFQNNESNMAFLYARAVQIGYELYVQDSTLHFSAPSEDEGPTLEWGANLRGFRPRLTTARQESEVTVRGWDPTAKREIVGRATQGKGAPEIGESRSGSQVASEAFQKDGKLTVVDRPVGDQREAEGLAQAIFDELTASFVTASGVATGDPRLRAGKVVTVEAVGDRFGGRYHISATSHSYRAEDYVTEFHVTGKHPRTLCQILNGKASQEVGAVVGIVTNNDDPEGMGRVKVKYPWLTDDEESAWARVVSFMAGKDRGAFFLPEVNDEVLLAFDHGNVHRPYVLGVLWNGQDKPPESNSVVLDGSGQVVQRIIKSRAGHTIILDDTSGGGGITVVDRAGNKIAIDSGSNALNIEVKGNLEISAKGKVTIKGDAGVEISSSANVDVKGAMIKLN